MSIYRALLSAAIILTWLGTACQPTSSPSQSPKDVELATSTVIPTKTTAPVKPTALKTLATPTTSPPPAISALPGPRFEHGTTEFTIILYENGYTTINLEAIPDAQGYRWVLSQGDQVIFDTFDDDAHLAGKSARFSRQSVPLNTIIIGAPALLEVQAMIDNQWTRSTSVTMYFFDDNASYQAWTQDRVLPSATPAACDTQWSRLKIGSNALLLPGKPNFIRSEPKKGDNVIGKLYPGAVITLLEGPICANGLFYWRASNLPVLGGVGWTAEGDGKHYWLEPVK